MSDYDFKTLNDKEFEILCADLLGQTTGRRYERFKPGKDGGVDGRYFSDDGKEVVLQCKHWSNTPLPQLIRELEKIEKPKLDILKPGRYVLAISSPLSRVDKKKIRALLSPHIRFESDVYGKEDLNDLLKANPDVERRHYKLWLHSSAVLTHLFNNAILGRSAFSLEDIRQESTKYVITSNHQKALQILEDLGIVIVSGAPGIGKTTLANHLCINYISQGYSYFKISDNIAEAEAVFNPDAKQIFYFDDFLGRNYLDAIKGNEATHVTQFIRRVAANKSKRFVLTSRSTILNQGKLLVDTFHHANIEKNEYELHISSLSELDKARILYSHMWHAGLQAACIDELYVKRRYREIIFHRNFNPRIISYITDPSRLENNNAATYWEHIQRSLNNPSQIWENPYLAQQDDFTRALIFLTVLNGQRISEHTLADAYNEYLSLPGNSNMQGRRDFQANIRVLTGSFLNRYVQPGKESTVDLFDPSIGDYVLKYQLGNISALKSGVVALKTLSSLATISSLHRNKFLSATQLFTICDEILKSVFADRFERVDAMYISKLCQLYLNASNTGSILSDRFRAAIRFVIDDNKYLAGEEPFRVVEFGLLKGIIAHQEALQFVQINEDATRSDGEIRAIFSLLGNISPETPEYDEVSELVRTSIMDLVSENLSEFIDVTIAFSRVHGGDYEGAQAEVTRILEKKLDDLGIGANSTELEWALQSFDVEWEFDNYLQSSWDGDRDGHYEYEAPVVITENAIDDLFDRS
jgi:adenylate kinase family enzyme